MVRLTIKPIVPSFCIVVGTDCTVVYRPGFNWPQGRLNPVGLHIVGQFGEFGRHAFGAEAAESLGDPVSREVRQGQQLADDAMGRHIAPV